MIEQIQLQIDALSSAIQASVAVGRGGTGVRVAFDRIEVDTSAGTVVLRRSESGGLSLPEDIWSPRPLTFDRERFYALCDASRIWARPVPSIVAKSRVIESDGGIPADRSRRFVDGLISGEISASVQTTAQLVARLPDTAHAARRRDGRHLLVAAVLGDDPASVVLCSMSASTRPGFPAEPTSCRIIRTDAAGVDDILETVARGRIPKGGVVVSLSPSEVRSGDIGDVEWLRETVASARTALAETMPSRSASPLVPSSSGRR